MHFITERLIIRPWEETDAAQCYLYSKDERVGPIAGWNPHENVEESLFIIQNVLSAPETYAICLKENNLAIGSIGLFKSTHNIDSENELEIGFWIGVPFWGQGLVAEAVKALQYHAFEDLNCDVLWAGFFDGNDQSKRVQEKCGFKYHHTAEDVFRPLMNDTKTEHYMYLAKEEWMNEVRN